MRLHKAFKSLTSWWGIVCEPDDIFFHLDLQLDEVHRNRQCPLMRLTNVNRHLFKTCKNLSPSHACSAPPEIFQTLPGGAVHVKVNVWNSWHRRSSDSPIIQSHCNVNWANLFKEVVTVQRTPSSVVGACILLYTFLVLNTHFSFFFLLHALHRCTSRLNQEYFQKVRRCLTWTISRCMWKSLCCMCSCIGNSVMFPKAPLFGWPQHVWRVSPVIKYYTV